uniref:Uncharacterized protein n=1 Tax=viral metagenome TaxID=1070528 RepID=A0A6M3IPR8_9ZZZZ
MTSSETSLFVTIGAMADINIGMQPEPDIIFYVNAVDEVMKIASNGDFFVHGQKVVNDIEVYHGFVKFLSGQGLYNKEAL